MTRALGILHPGEMGISIAASALHTLGRVYWCPAGRSAATRARAEQQGLTALASLQELCATCELIIGVCPPHAARAQACAVVDAGFTGCYVEANAIAPATVQDIGAQMTAAGITFVDGGIIGLPAWQPHSTWLYLAGPQADSVAACFSKGPLETAVLGATIGQASALKMCFAAWNKGSTALLATVLAAAEASGVRAALEAQWDIYTPDFAEQSHKRVRGGARKAWRFTGEMEEIAATFAAASVPPEFFQGAAASYARQSEFKDSTEPPPLAELLAAIGKRQT